MLSVVIMAAARHPTQDVDRTVRVVEQRGSGFTGSLEVGLIKVS